MDKQINNRMAETGILWAVFIVILIGVNLFLFFKLYSGKDELNLAKDMEDAMKTRIAGLVEENESMQDENIKLHASLEYYKRKSLFQPGLSQKEKAELRAKGLENPEKEIRADLMKHNELIPFKGIMGGNMRFLSERDIYVLSTSWVRAYFEDGHIYGWILLEYQISDGGKIQWKVINSYLD